MSSLRFVLVLAISTLVWGAQEGTVVPLKAVKGAPFSALASTRTTQVLPDGNHVSRTIFATIARDSEGRTRHESPMAGGSIIFIQDPVAGFAYVIDSNRKTVHRIALPTGESKAASATASTSEPLSSQIIEGFQTDGSRVTRHLTTSDAGSEHPFDVAVESWYSNELQTVITRKTSDPRRGETDYTLTNIQRAEPDQGLFQIPADYRLEDQTKPASTPDKKP